MQNQDQFNFQNQQQNQGQQVTPQMVHQSPNVECNNCSGTLWRQVMIVKKVSKILTGQSHDTLVPMSVFRCDDCGEVFEDHKKIISNDAEAKK